MLNLFEKYMYSHKRYSEHTIRAYIDDLRSFMIFAGIEDISENFESNKIREWIVYLMENNYSKSSIHRKISALRSYFKFLQKNGLIKENPINKIVLPKKPKRLPVFVPSKDFEYFEALFEENFESYRDRIILEIIYFTGVRRSELANIKENDIDFSSKQIKVIGKRQKERQIPLAPQLEKSLKKYLALKKQKGYVSTYLIVNDKGEVVDGQYIYRKVQRYLSIMSTLDKKSPHVLRHTFATVLLNNGADINAIKELLGHSSLLATQVYTHTTIEHIKQTYKKTHPRG